MSSSLLKLLEAIPSTVETGVVPVSQGYVFAENLENPGLMEVFEKIPAKPVTTDELTRD